MATLRAENVKFMLQLYLIAFRTLKGINLKMINNYQVIGLYGMKYRSKKKTERKGETRTLPSRVLLARPFHF